MAVISGADRLQEGRWGKQPVRSSLNKPGMSKSLHEVAASEIATKSCQFPLNTLSCTGLGGRPWQEPEEGGRVEPCLAWQSDNQMCDAAANETHDGDVITYDRNDQGKAKADGDHLETASSQRGVLLLQPTVRR